MKNSRYRIKNPGEEKKLELLACIIKIWIMATVIVAIVFAVNARVLAFTGGNPSTGYDNYDCDLFLPLEGVGRTSESIFFRNVDLSGYTEYMIPNFVYIPRCSNCGMDFYPYSNEVYLIVNDAVLYNCNYLYCDDPISNPHYDTRVFPVYTRGDMAHATVEIRTIMSDVTCMYCKTMMPATFYCKGVHFYGKRGSAVMKETSITTSVGGSATISPTYDGDTDHVVWGIRYPGETGFTPLNEGSNRDGLAASGTTNGSLSISNIPYVQGGFDVGVFVYTKDGALPGGTTYPDTPFFTHITVSDKKAPTVSVTKKVNPNGGPVIVTVSAFDEGGLHSEPYSWDDGRTFSANAEKSYDTAGVYKVVVRDAAGNTTTEKFYIDSIELKTASGTSGGSGGSVSEKEQGSGKGTNGGTSSGGTSGQGSQSTGTGTKGTQEAGTSSLDDTKGGNTTSEKGGSVSKNESTGSDVKSKEEGKGTGKGGGGGNGGSGSDDLSPSETDEDNEDTFEKIKENSEEYIISMQENYSEEEDEDNKAGVNMVELENEDYLNSYTNESDKETDGYKPLFLKSSTWTYALFIILFIIFLLILAFLLFFGVLILADKETELSKVSGKGGMKIPVAISFVTYGNKRFSICLRELFEKHDVLYLRPGILFVHMYEGEKVSITTKFKGDKKREIALETIHKEIKAGTKKQKSKGSLKA